MSRKDQGKKIYCRSDPEKDDHDSVNMNVGVGLGFSWTAASRAPGWSLPEPVTGSNGAPACILIVKSREKNDHHQRRRSRTEHL